MGREIILLLIAVVHATQLSSKYLLVDIEDTNDNTITPWYGEYYGTKGNKIKKLKSISINSEECKIP